MVNKFEFGRLLGRLEIILEDIPDKEKDLQELESKLKYGFDITELAKIYGRLEQKMINMNKNREDINVIKEIFKEFEENNINDFKKKTLNKIGLQRVPIKIFYDNNIFTVEDLTKKTYEEIESINGISKSSLRMIIDILNENGVYLKE